MKKIIGILFFILTLFQGVAFAQDYQTGTQTTIEGTYLNANFYHSNGTKLSTHVIVLDEPAVINGYSDVNITYSGKDTTAIEFYGDNIPFSDGDRITVSGILQENPLTPYYLTYFSFANGAGFSKVETYEQIELYINDVHFDYDQKAILKDGVTLIPVRGVLEALGCTVEWFSDTQRVYVHDDYMHLTLKIGKTQYNINGINATFSIAPQIVNDRTMIPLRTIAECFGCEVIWDDATRSVNIKSPENNVLEYKYITKEYSIYGTKISIDLPSNWLDECIVKESKDTLSFYDRTNHEAGFGGFLLSLSSTNPLVDNCGEVTSNGSVTIYFEGPTDVQSHNTDYSLKKLYKDKEKQIPQVLSSIKIIE